LTGCSPRASAAIRQGLAALLLLVVPAAAAAAKAPAAKPYQLAPYKDELFQYANILDTQYEGDFLLVEYNRPRDLYARDVERGTKVDLGAPVRPQPNGWVDLAALLRQLHDAGIQHLMVEGGARIITSFLEARLVDYVTVTIAPTFMGGLPAVGRLTRPAATPTTPTTTASDPTALCGPALSRWVSARLGHDLVLSGEVAWPAD